MKLCGKSRIIAMSTTPSMRRSPYARSHGMERGAPLFGKAQSRTHEHEPVETPAVADGDRAGDEATEAVAKDIDIVVEVERVEELGGAVGDAGDRRPRRGRAAESRQVRQYHATPRRQQRHGPVEDRAIRQQGV